MTRPPVSSALFPPLSNTRASQWEFYRSRFKSAFAGADIRVLVSFWLFGLINNVSYVIILSAALDLVGPSIPKGLVLLADVLPSFVTKLVAPYFIHIVPYYTRIIIMCLFSAAGMLVIAVTPSVLDEGGSISAKLFGVVLASLSSGLGELSFLSLTHYYGPFSLAAWGSGTGAAGLIGSGLYVLLTSTIDLTVKTSIYVCATLPFVMPLAFFIILPRGLFRRANSRTYTAIPRISIDDNDVDSSPVNGAEEALFARRFATPCQQTRTFNLLQNLTRARSLFFPYMLPLLLVYIAEYTINQGLTPVLLFPLPKTPFSSYRSFYPTYAFLYQIGVFISRSSSPFLSLTSLYIPSLLQCLNLLLLLTHALYNWLPNVFFIFAIVLWEGLLGGAVYVNTFAKIMSERDGEDREWSLGATSVSDSGGIMMASMMGMALEPWLCGWNVRAGRGWCRVAGGRG